MNRGAEERGGERKGVGETERGAKESIAVSQSDHIEGQ